MERLLEPSEVDASVDRRLERIAQANQAAWKWLGERDRAMVALASQGTTHRMLAAAFGISPGTVTKRLNNIHDRLRNPETHLLLEATCPLPDLIRKTSLLHRITGLSTREIARMTGLSHMTVRENLRYANGVLRVIMDRRLAV
jgi:DNA-directed RNA polymerase specialized sigma24 family protein